MEENEPSMKKTKNKKAKVAIITVSIIAILLGGLQVYATTNNYGNVFFMIKNLITTGQLSGKNDIFSDKDITLSYKSIELDKGLKIQANRLEIKDGKTKLYLSVKSEDGEQLPLKYEVTTKNNEGNETTTKLTGQNPGNTDYFLYEDVLTLNYAVEDNQIIVLKISDSKDKQLRTLEINLQTREIIVKGEETFEKISQIELRKYLDKFAELNNGIQKPDVLLYIAQEMEDNYKDYMSVDLSKEKETITDRALKNNIISEFYGDNVEYEEKSAEGSKLPAVKVLKGMYGWKYDAEFDKYIALTAGEEYRHGHCLEIADISYENDIYTVKFVYVLATKYDEDNEKIEDLEQYETIIKLKRNENSKYSKYQIVSLEKGIQIKDKVNSTVEENTTNTSTDKTNTTNTTNNSSATNTNNTTNTTNTTTNSNANLERVDNYVSYFNWVKYNTPGLKFEYPTELNFERKNVDDVVATITGTLTGRDIDTNEPIKSKIKVKIYKPIIIDEKIKKNLQYAPNGTEYSSFITFSGVRWYEGRADSDELGYTESESYSSFNLKSDGTYELRQIEFVTDNRNNLKVTNFINHLLGSTELTNW